MSVSAPHMSARSWSLLILLSILWGGSFLFNRYALLDLEPLTVVGGRVIIAALVLHIVLRMRGTAMPTDLGTWRSWLVMGAINNVVPFALIVWGQTRIAPGLASILNASTPLFGVVLAHFLTRDELLTRGRAFGVLLGLGGVTVLVGPDVIGSGDNSLIGQLAILGASSSYAVAGIYGRRLRGHAPIINATGMVTCSAAIMVGIVLLADQPWNYQTPGAKSVLSVLGLGVLSTAIGYILYYRILSAAGATNVLLVTLLVPVSALWMSWLLLSEIVDRADLLGMILIAGGLLAIDGRMPRMLVGKVVQKRESSASVLGTE